MPTISRWKTASPLPYLPENICQTAHLSWASYTPGSPVRLPLALLCCSWPEYVLPWARAISGCCPFALSPAVLPPEELSIGNLFPCSYCLSRSSVLPLDSTAAGHMGSLGFGIFPFGLTATCFLSLARFCPPGLCGIKNPLNPYTPRVRAASLVPTLPSLLVLRVTFSGRALSQTLGIY